MADKMICPGCDSYTSSIFKAYENGDPCPVCGLSSEAAHEIEAVREARGNQELKDKLETAIKERDQAQRELAWANSRLAHLSRVLGEAVARIGTPLKEEEPRW